MLIFISSASSRSVGSLSPGRNSPERIIPSSCWMNSSFTVGATISRKAIDPNSTDSDIAGIKNWFNDNLA